MNKSLTLAIALFVGGALLTISTPAPEAKAGWFRHHCCGARAACHGRHRHHRRAHRCSGYNYYNGCHGGYMGCHGSVHYGSGCSGGAYYDGYSAADEDLAPPAPPQEPATPASGEAGVTSGEPASPSDATAPPPPGSDA